jgi:hypothetical protein
MIGRDDRESQAIQKRLASLFGESIRRYVNAPSEANRSRPTYFTVSEFACGVGRMGECRWAIADGGGDGKFRLDRREDDLVKRPAYRGGSRWGFARIDVYVCRLDED